jgi:hypothetical protein
MERIIREFIAWNKENVSFYQELKEHDSLLYTRFQPVYEVLSHLTKALSDQSMAFSVDLEKIMMVGLEFLHDQFSSCKLYLDTYFSGDFHHFLDYEKIVNALLLLEDIRYELIERTQEGPLDSIDLLAEELETMLEKKAPVPDSFNLYIDDVLHQALGDKLQDFVGIIDIFVSIADTLDLDLVDTSEIVIGKEIKGE